ncbi:DUF4350 domain-containing protein [Halobacterium salinarum]|uniref:DUF4350 domain-containing protein n=1 Tax=Halobacterium salinarum TaxID=2242 RepID=UPI0025540C31|nr:DUF4350 domain-containing protein [Halobacterium salinarum]MDL0120020.1 DUF4350 domain-containing protein [Halobacterium salinarum]MDL0128296.1 DUF4350 domain-containing protein [Halobacterium salinarum]
MEVLDHEITYPRLLMGALALTIVLAAVVGLTTSSAGFGAYNSAWDGTQDFRDLTSSNGAETVIAQSAKPYQVAEASTTTAVVLAPTTNYSTTQTDTVAAFLNQGGTLVVAGDIGAASNRLLADLGVRTRIENTPLRDDEQNYRSPALPIAVNVSTAPMTRGVSQVTLNYPTILAPGEDSTVLVSSSRFSYADETRDGVLNDSETVRSRPVVASESYGDGRVVVLSDPSLFINSMQAQPDNQQFAQNLVGSSQTVIFDYTHTADLPIAMAIIQKVGRSDWLQLAVALIAVAGMVIGWRRERAFPSLREIVGREPVDVETVGLSEDAIIGGLEQRYPDWDRERIERVARSITSGRRKKNTDE